MNNFSGMKPAKLYSEQLDLLKSHGLSVPDENFALHVLAHHNYYRLSVYRIPFTIAGNTDRFTPGATFNQIWELYCFDRSLRRLVLEGCKRIEISVRSRWAYEVAHALGADGYLDSKNFINSVAHAELLRRVGDELSRGKEGFIKYHRQTLRMNWPPVWVLTEILSFGASSNFLRLLNRPQLRQQISDTYHFDEKIFCSLFHHLSTVRNIAAHHSRLWNRVFPISFQLPRKKPAHLYPNFNYTKTAAGNINERRIYNTLVLMIYLLQIIEPGTTWPIRLKQHLLTLPENLLPDMDFPGDWQTRPIWSSI